MKKFLPAAAGLLSIACWQPAFSQSSTPCDVKGIVTDPAQPASNSEYPLRTNTFNWYVGQQNSGRSWNLNNPAINEASIWMPWEQTDNTSVTHILGKRDLPKDGWELLKRDFGYNDSGSPITGSRNPYVVLYNKRTGMLRVFVAMGELFNSYQFAEIKLRFNSTGSQKKAGTLNRMDGLGVALENTTSGLANEFAAVVPFLNQRTKWFMADFPMEYDPCACQFDSKFTIDVRLISQADVKLTGTTTGTLVTTNVNNPGATQTGADYEQSIPLTKRVQNAAKAGQKTYKSLNSFASGVKKQLTAQGTKTNTTDAEAKKAAVDKLKEALSKNDFLKQGLKALPYVGAAVSVLDSFFGGGKEESNPQQPISLQPMTLEMTTQTTGTISATNLYQNITFNNPGTRAITIPEEYPYYNEALGIFSLIRKPVVEIHATSTYDGTYFGRVMEYHVAEELQYVINPASGLEVQDFQVAIVQQGSKYPGNTLTDWEYEGIIAKEDGTTNHAVRTPYVDSGCLLNQVFMMEVGDIKNQFPTTGLPVYLKFMLNLRSKNAPATTQNTLIVLKYPVTVRNVSSITVDDTRPCLAVQPPMDAASIQTFCTSSIYNAAMNLRPAGFTASTATTSATPTVTDVQVYPNPTADVATLRFTGAAAGQVSAYLTDMVGHRVLTVLDKTSVVPGEQQQVFSTTRLAAGLYQCVVETSGGQKTFTRLSVVH